MELGQNAVAAATMAGVISVGAASPFALSIGDLGGATALAAIGVLARHAMDTAAERKANKAAHLPKAEWATLDYQAVMYDCIGAAFLGPALLALARWIGHVPDYAFAAVIIGAGVYGVQVRSALWSVISTVIDRWKRGGKDV